MSFLFLSEIEPGKASDVEPTCLNTTATGHGVEIGRDKLSVRYLADGRCVLSVCLRMQAFAWAS